MVKDCCSSSIKDKQCIRKKIKKYLNYLVNFSFEDCENPNGFTMESSWCTIQRLHIIIKKRIKNLLKKQKEEKI